MNKLISALAAFLFLSSTLFSSADNFSDGFNAAINIDNGEAARIFRVSAEKGDRNSQHILGVMLYKGLGVRQNYREAFKWLSLAADQGHSQAKLDLSIMIYHNKGIPKNHIDKYK